MENELIIREAEPDDLSTIGYLAQQIWPVTYKDILPPQQIEYMMNLFYSPSSLDEQVKKKKHIFLIAELEEEPVGFASYSNTETDGVFKLHKIYVLPTIQGKGLGKALLEFIIAEIKELKGKALQLNVNRTNQAKAFYERLGFSIIKEEDIDIGNNYFMNDYIMEKKI